MTKSTKSIINIKDFFNETGKKKDLQVFYVIDEKSTMARLGKNPAGEVLLVSYPRIARTGKQDNPTYQSAIAIWVMEKALTGNITDDKEDEQYDRLLQKTFDVIDYMEDMASEQPCSFAGTIKFETIEITPEYRTFGGYNGWVVEMII